MDGRLRARERERETERGGSYAMESPRGTSKAWHHGETSKNFRSQRFQTRGILLCARTWLRSSATELTSSTRESGAPSAQRMRNMTECDANVGVDVDDGETLAVERFFVSLRGREAGESTFFLSRSGFLFRFFATRSTKKTLERCEPASRCRGHNLSRSSRAAASAARPGGHLPTLLARGEPSSLPPFSLPPPPQPHPQPLLSSLSPQPSSSARPPSAR